MEVCSSSSSSVNNGDGSGKQLHVMMFPWLAHGHISPFVQLSATLAQLAINVSFVSTPLNIANLKSFFAHHQNSPGKVQSVELRLPAVEGLPAGIESTKDLPIHLMPLFDKALDGLEEPLERLLRQMCPDCIFFDFAQWWVPRAAAKMGIPTIVFATFGAAFAGYGLSPAWQREGEGEEISAETLTKPPPSYPSDAISWKLHEAESVLGSYRVQQPSGISYYERGLRSFDGCRAIVVRTCNEIEGKFIKYLQTVTGKPVFPAGPLLPDISSPVSSEEEWGCIKWLEAHAVASVVYVSFGSQIFMSEEQIHEVALGLEASGQPFLWALRCPDEKQLGVLLPQGFQQRIGKRGLVVGEWVPQRQILSHASIGGFLSHCGWGSLIEAMSSGVPLVTLPMHLDQCLNSRLVVRELEIGLEVTKRSDGSLNRDEICKTVRELMVEGGGREVRRKAREMGNVFNNQILSSRGEGGITSQEVYINDVIGHLHFLKAASRAE